MTAVETMPLLAGVVLGAYFLVLLLLAGYGLHRWFLLALYRRHRAHGPPIPEPPGELPWLTVQLPVFNELYVVERLIRSVCALDYPRDRLDVQVLDDSTDETTEVVARLVAQMHGEGVSIVHIHRGDRHGFKAGALAQGLARARGELIAIFDADFVPAPSFARRLVPHFADPEVGMVQARWGHLNADHSPLTRVQSMLLDGHFVIEHTARNRSGRFFNFNGTAGIWRSRCIVDAGGWQHDTLTEDLDLSYRAQMRGWKFVFLPDEVAPAELPVEMTAFKSQQHRWAKGSIQTARKLLPAILRSTLPFEVKTEAVYHLTANVCYPLTVLLALLVVPAVWLRAGSSPWTLVALDLPLFALSTVSITRFYVLAQREALGTRRGLLRWVPFLMVVGIGLSLNNARAVCEALRGRRSDFERTPKYNLGRGESASRKRYRQAVPWDTWLEAVLGIYFAVSVGAAAASGLWGAIPFLTLFACGFTYTAGLALAQAARRTGVPARRHRTAEAE